MKPLRMSRYGVGLVLRAAVLMAALSTYLVSPDDVVWRLVKAAPHSRFLEHVAFSFAALMLAVALLLKVHMDAQANSRSSTTRAGMASLLQAFGIGFLLPLPGFLLLVLGELSVSLFVDRRQRVVTKPSAGQDLRPTTQSARWRDAIVGQIGLCCALASMVAFSVVLVDRVADVLFATTALVSLAASARTALLATRRTS